MAKKFKWVVEFEVDEIWVADGFNLDDDRALEMLRGDLQFAYTDEVKARVVKAPAPEGVRKAQGYSS